MKWSWNAKLCSTDPNDLIFWKKYENAKPAHHYFAAYHSDLIFSEVESAKTSPITLKFFPENKKSKSIFSWFLSNYYFVIFLMDNFETLRLTTV